jgi:hypothetical protein
MCAAIRRLRPSGRGPGPGRTDPYGRGPACHPGLGPASMRLVPLTRMPFESRNHRDHRSEPFSGPRAGARKRRQLIRQKRRPIAQVNPSHVGPECDAASIYPGLAACREMNVNRGLMRSRMIGAAEARRCCCAGAEATGRESQNENSTRRPDGRISSQCSR